MITEVCTIIIDSISISCFILIGLTVLINRMTFLQVQIMPYQLSIAKIVYFSKMC